MNIDISQPDEFDPTTDPDFDPANVDWDISTESQRSTPVEPTAEDIAAEMHEQGFEIRGTEVRHPACGEWVSVLEADNHECPVADWS